ncbi:hypothetical protein ABZ078_23475 [Streptomyces sp. NPDC006385]
MKRRVVAVLAVAVTGLVLSALPAAVHRGLGRVGSDDWNIFLTNVLL